MDDPEGNLVIVERVVHENQWCFPDWAHGWGGTAHVLTSTQDDAVEQKEQKEVKYIVPPPPKKTTPSGMVHGNRSYQLDAKRIF